jgi:hypothetical protein
MKTIVLPLLNVRNHLLGMTISKNSNPSSDCSESHLRPFDKIQFAHFLALAKYFPTRRTFSLGLGFVAHSNDFH